MTSPPPSPPSTSERSSIERVSDPSPQVVLGDVTLREYGQNLRAQDLQRFSPSLVVEVARLLLGAGIRRLELFSCVSPRVAPAMATERLRAIAHGLGPLAGITVVTLVPNRRGFESFLALGLGPEGLGHHLGLFLSAVEEHNRLNLGCSVRESLEECRVLAALARAHGVPIVAYLSAAFGFAPSPAPKQSPRSAHSPSAPLDEPVARLVELVESLRSLGALTVTLSDLQGVRSPAETHDRLGALLGHLGPDAAAWLGYHPHHVVPERGVALAQAAFEAGVRLFDGSLGAVGGCVTGAPGNAPTEGLLGMLCRQGATTRVDPMALHRASLAFDETLTP